MTVLVTGGAGYIGSHMTYALIDRGEHVVVLDNLSTGIRSLVSEHAAFVQSDVGDQATVRRIITDHHVDSVIHFAGSVVVPESVSEPLLYYANNTVASRSLIEACVKESVKYFVFSSTAAVYGSPQTTSVSEESPTVPMNPYGRSKLMTEWMLEDASRAHDEFNYITLRYFNVAGADPLGRTGQSTPKATHLIKRTCQVALGRLPYLEIFGTDFSTPDGTGVRDYIHVTDLVEAHLLALDALRSGAGSAKYNCGYGHGFSVREVVAEMEKITGHRLPVKEAPRRPGDPAVLIADPTRLKSALNWRPKYEDLQAIIRSALDWERRFNERPDRSATP
jgi:UDP-glucose 4-epimerase